MLELHDMKTCVGMEVKFHAFLTSALDGADGQLYTPEAFLLKKQPLSPSSPTV
jgi:hypothetical protein